MKKVLIGLVIALMMTGSGYGAPDIDYVLRGAKAPKSECIKALKKGKKIDFPAFNNKSIFYVYDDKLYSLYNYGPNTIWCEIYS